MLEMSHFCALLEDESRDMKKRNLSLDSVNTEENLFTFQNRNLIYLI